MEANATVYVPVVMVRNGVPKILIHTAEWTCATKCEQRHLLQVSHGSNIHLRQGLLVRIMSTNILNLCSAREIAYLLFLPFQVNTNVHNWLCQPWLVLNANPGMWTGRYNVLFVYPSAVYQTSLEAGICAVFMADAVKIYEVN